MQFNKIYLGLLCLSTAPVIPTLQSCNKKFSGIGLGENEKSFVYFYIYPFPIKSTDPNNVGEELRESVPEGNLSSFILACELPHDKRHCRAVSTEVTAGNVLERSWGQYPGDIKEVVCTALFQYSILKLCHKTSFTPCIHMLANPLSESSTDPTLRWCVR